MKVTDVGEVASGGQVRAAADVVANTEVHLVGGQVRVAADVVAVSPPPKNSSIRWGPSARRGCEPASWVVVGRASDVFSR